MSYYITRKDPGKKIHRRDQQQLCYSDRAVALAAATCLREEHPGSRFQRDHLRARVGVGGRQDLHASLVADDPACGLTADVVSSMRRIPGCPYVAGGRGHRFASVEAFKGFLAGLAFEQRLLVPAYLAMEKEKLVEEIAGLAWGADGGETARLRRRSYSDLLHMRDEWRLRDAADKERYHPSTVPG